MKIKERILSGLCAVSLAFGMSRTKSDAKIINYVIDSIFGSGLSFGFLIAFDFAYCNDNWKNLKWENFKKQKVLSSLFVITNVLGLMDFINRLVDAKYVQNLEAELQKLKNPDKKINKTTDGKNEKLNVPTNGEKKG